MIILIRVRSSPAIWPYAPPPHIHRSPRGDLLCRLHPSTVLPILAGEDQKLVITHGAGSSTDKIRINYIRRGDQLARRRPPHLCSVPPPPPRQPRQPTCLAPPPRQSAPDLPPLANPARAAAVVPEGRKRLLLHPPILVSLSFPRIDLCGPVFSQHVGAIP